MDINIDDILAELDRDTTVVDQSDPLLPSDGNTTMIDSSLDPSRMDVEKESPGVVTAEADYRRLITLWRNERCSPELLPYPSSLMSRMLRRLQAQMDNIESIAMGFFEDSDNHESVDEYAAPHPASTNNKLPLLCMEADLERLRFVIRSYLRCRLSKVDEYALYLKQLEQTEKEIMPLNELLSAQELEYHERHFTILLKLLNNSVLKHMPSELQAINDTEGSVSMIDEPDWNKFVFVYVKTPSANQLQYEPALSTGEYGKSCYTVNIEELEEDVELAVGGIYVMRYLVIRELLREDKIELI
ncbi:hypothetical protein HG535_0H03320 [Zygotorulaspora mrakii]|uniref:DNA replication complex GINS protein SLD5 n=1 Tax=Zygotorulaspora mrakii TaxID=42260 RepID=A0A7H9B8J1_ZYGMR|nr:uncharacterized protein HG535_0H03320 [Zygotorulaspora mrakii]QLG75005.1 hypothetical protein HG535_0H03320 [Zygotorulaspora mrakii]